MRRFAVPGLALLLAAGCSWGERPGEPGPPVAAESCMACHNGSRTNDYAGGGIRNPHPFGNGGNALLCTQCHGGDPADTGKDGSHVPPPPEIGDDRQQIADPQAYFNRLTLTGIDKLGDYTDSRGRTWSGLDYLQFVNPGDLRVTADGRSCGAAGCHGGAHVDWVNRYPIATSTGFFSGTRFSIGVDNAIPAHRGLHQDTAADQGFRAVEDLFFQPAGADTGQVGRLVEVPERAVWGDRTGVHDNPAYDVANLPQSLTPGGVGGRAPNQVIAGSPLETLVTEQISITCGDCHLGSAGANNRFADFRSSGCTACHMEYSYDGRSRSSDPNVNKNEPVNPDQIVAPERPHVSEHLIRTVARELPDGTQVSGISDRACVGCHQGSNRTVLQFWGIRLDQNRDLVNGTQYPANPASFRDAANDTRLFDPAVGNQTFNGRTADQLIAFEDYDGDGRDDTPPDIHHEKDMVCIDCHGSRDMHGGTAGDITSGQIASRMEQAVGITCESCHGGIDEYAQVVDCIDDEGRNARCAIDRFGNALGNVTLDADGSYWLRGRLDGKSHYVVQTRDTVQDNGKVHPATRQPVYSPAASFAMGRADDRPGNSTGPIQDGYPVTPGFAHSDSMDCASCHSSWANNCIGCHLKTEYNDDPNDFFFSNITGERMVLKEGAADFTYISPLPFTLGVGPSGKITQTQPGIKMFYRYQDRNGQESPVFAFTDRTGKGNNPEGGGAFGALAHNKVMSHSIRGRVTGNNEGMRYCVACHLTQSGLDKFRIQYDAFRANMANGNFANLDYGLLKEHIGENPSNRLDSPIWVHMVAGLGSGLFLFDETGCPVNPLDGYAARHHCPDGTPADRFALHQTIGNVVRYNLDRVVEATGRSNASNGHPMENGQPSRLRDGAANPALSGPLGGRLIQKLTDPESGVVLDRWYDADGNLQQATAP